MPRSCREIDVAPILAQSPSPMALIVFEDEHLLVVNKPAGWNTHAPSPFAGEGIYEWLKNREPRWAKLAIIHRLDKETSGLLVFGKTPEANRSLTQQFTARDVRKKYLLLTDRLVATDTFVVRSAIARSGAKYISRAGGERAETRFKTITPTERQRVIIEAEPVTGRTHQIRVHAAENGFPILGDSLYGGTKAERVFLHATSLSLRHPVTNESLTFEAVPDWNAPSRALRGAVIDFSATNAFRLIHGASDGYAGLFVDRLGEFLLAQSETDLSDAQRELLAQLSKDNAARGVYHKRLARNVRQINAAEASPRLLFGEAAPDRFTIRENGLNFELSFTEGYSVGLFFDQRDNRRRLLVNYIAPEFFISQAKPQSAQTKAGLSSFSPLRGRSVLNVFAYTCGLSVAAAKAGARTTSLDLSRKYLDWGKRNFACNDIDLAHHDFIYGDAFDWMRRLTRKGRSFDCVILDPPTFSQSKESGAWQAERDYGKLVSAALPLLKSNGVLFASTNAARLEPERFLDAVLNAVKVSGRNSMQQHYVPQPPDFPVTRGEPAYLKTAWLRVQ